jgi:deoxyribonuclease-4
MPKVGAHVSAAVSLELSLDRAKEIGAEATQIFVSPPQSWNQVDHPADEISAYLNKAAETGIGPTFIHGIYLINMASDIPANYDKGISWLIYSLKMAEKLGIVGTIFHLGSHKGRGFYEVEKQVTDGLIKVLTGSSSQGRTENNFSSTEAQLSGEVPPSPYLILENSASKGNAIGGKLAELGKLLKNVSDPRLKVCLDTQHAFAAGYDVRTKEGIDRLVEEFQQEIGLENLVVIHTNDSKTEFDSGRDRHENIGEGFIGEEGFRHLINHSAFKDVPFVLEVPGFADKGPDKENVDKLKSMIDSRE